VTQVITSGSDEVPERPGSSVLDPYRELVLKEMHTCKGNLARVHEELVAEGILVGYSTLARFVKVRGLGKPPRLPVGAYHFDPGQEMQFDTSPHDVDFTGGTRRCQCAALVLCFSRMTFFQYYARFTRFEAKLFLTAALEYFGGACSEAMVDNTNVVVLYGTGPDAVIAPEMLAFAQRLGFVFIAHRIGDANRSARVERCFHTVENNFLAGRTFSDFDDINRRGREYCDKNNGAFKKHLRTRPVDLFVTERLSLVPLPPHIPEVYNLHHRTVDLAGYVHLHRNSYSVPWQLLQEAVEIRESLQTVRVFHKHNEVAAHERVEPGLGRRLTDPKHRPPRGSGARDERPVPQEERLRKVSTTVDAYVTALKRRSVGRGAARLMRLDRFRTEYPPEAFEKAVAEALQYGMFDLARLERMVLRQVAGQFFPHVATPSHQDKEDPNE